MRYVPTNNPHYLSPITYYLLPVTYFGVIFNIIIVIIRKMIFGNHVPSTGGRPPDTENIVETC